MTGQYVKSLNTELVNISFLQFKSRYLDIRDRAFNSLRQSDANMRQ